jgi:hypothetical protein
MKQGGGRALFTYSLSYLFIVIFLALITDHVAKMLGMAL